MNGLKEPVGSPSALLLTTPPVYLQHNDNSEGNHRVNGVAAR